LMERYRSLLAGLFVAALMVGCGGGEETETAETVTTSQKPPSLDPEIKVTLNADMGAENVGLLVAKEEGYFEDLGLNVLLLSPARPRRPVTYVTDRTDDIAVAQLPQVVLAKEKGAPVVAVGSVIPSPTAAMIWLRDSGIRSIADLRGKLIAVPGIPYQEGFLRTVLARAGLTLQDVTVKRVGFNLLPALLHGQADAIFGGSSNFEGAALKSRGAESTITHLQSLGIPAYDELVVVVRTDRLAEEPQMARDFMSAVVRGTKVAVDDPKAALKAIEEGLERDFRLTRREIEAQLRETLPLLSKTGRMDPDQTTALVNWMQRQGMIGRPMPTSALLTNEYLPQP
jgi:putative hydroxymethylpyrimidine transport system substrate-binding protein